MQGAGVTQICAGHPAGCEAAIHALRNVFAEDAVMLVDADNAFNRLNRAVALHNIQFTCPPLATTSTARLPVCLSLVGWNFPRWKAPHRDAHCPWNCMQSALCH